MLQGLTKKSVAVQLILSHRFVLNIKLYTNYSFHTFWKIRYIQKRQLIRQRSANSLGMGLLLGKTAE